MTWRGVDLDRTFDWAEMSRSAKPGATIKGMFVDDLAKLVARPGEARRYIAFKDYSEAECNEIVTRAAKQVYPRLTPRRALHAVGLQAFPTLRDSLIGRVVFGVLGNNVKSVLSLAGRGYQISTSSSVVRLVEARDDACVFDIERVAIPIEGYQVGVFEGAIVACGRKPGPSRINLRSECSGFVEVTWL